MTQSGARRGCFLIEQNESGTRFQPGPLSSAGYEPTRLDVLGKLPEHAAWAWPRICLTTSPFWKTLMVGMAMIY